MGDAVPVAMLAYINDLQRSINANEKFIGEVLALANEAQASRSDWHMRSTMLDLARRHRVKVIEARAKMDAMSERFIARFGVERFRQERSKHLVRSRRSM